MLTRHIDVAKLPFLLSRAQNTLGNSLLGTRYVRNFFPPKRRLTEWEIYSKGRRDVAGTKGGTCNHKATPQSQLWHLLAQVATACSHKNS